MRSAQLSVTERGEPHRVWRVLVAAPFPPRLDGRHGGSRALGQLLKGLASRHRVGLLVLRSEDERTVDPLLAEMCDFVEEVAVPPVGTSTAARLSNRIRLRVALVRGLPTWAALRRAPEFAIRLAALVREWRPDVVQLEYRIMGQFSAAVDGLVPTLLVDHDPDGPDETSSSLLSLFETRAWRSLGAAAAVHVDSLVVFTERDRRTVAALSGSTPVFCVPLGYDLPPAPLDPIGADPPAIAWVGSFIHPPNVDAAERLVRDIFPHVRARFPSASLELVGSHGHETIGELVGDGVRLHVDVPDVTPYLQEAAVFAAPIRLGGGMRVKVLEALSYGKATVASQLAIEGLDLVDGEHVVVADDDRSFADALVALLEDPGLRVSIATAARRWAEENLGLDSAVRGYEKVYVSTVRAQRRTAR
jgi:glycosyltransferase involved in cell wall biosynthesis